MNIKEIPKKGIALCLSFIMVATTAFYMVNAAAPSSGNQMPQDDYGVNYSVFDTVAIPSATEGKYDATVTAHLTANPLYIARIVGGGMQISWNQNLTVPVVSGVETGTSLDPEMLDEDIDLGLLTRRQYFYFSKEDMNGALIPGENDTGYKEFQLNFEGIEAEPGEILKDAVRVRDYFNPHMNESTISVEPTDPDMDGLATVRGEVNLGSIRIPGRTIVYSNTDGTETYKQTYKTDEELNGKTILNLKDTGISGSEETFLGWATEPDQNHAEYNAGGSLSEKDGNGEYKIPNLTLYPVFDTGQHLDGPWIDYTVSDVVAEVDPTLAKGRYNATLEVMLTADMSIFGEISGGTMEFFWPTRLPMFEIKNGPELGGSSGPTEDSQTGLSRYTQLFKWNTPKNPQGGLLTPVGDGTGYHKYQIYFYNFGAEPGEVIDGIKAQDLFSDRDGYSFMSGLSPEGEELFTLRCHVKTGSITVPGKKIVYKADDSENTKTYEQIYYSNEEVENATVLENDPTQNPNQPLTKPNFEAPAGKTFGGWSDQPNATDTIYQPGDALSNMSNMTLYPVWIAKDSYTITYHGNGGIPDKETDEVLIGDAVNEFPMATHPDSYIFLGWFTLAEGGEEVSAPYTPADNTDLYAHWETTYKVSYSAGNGTGELTDENSPYQKNAYVVVKNPEGLTSPSPDYIFAGWESNVPVRVGNSEKLILNPDDTFRMPENNVTLTAIWDNTISDVCPIVLDLTNETLKNKKNEDITSGFVRQKAFIAVTYPAFEECNARHTHELIIKGSTDKEVIIGGDGRSEINTYVNGVNARILDLDTEGNVTFGSDGAITSNQFYNTAGEGLMLGPNVNEVKINDGVIVTSISEAPENSPIAGTDGKVKVLDLSLHELTTKDMQMKINSTEVTVRANYQRIAVLDNKEGAWLKDDIQITDTEGNGYVRGVAENADDTKYINSDYSDNNLFGNSFNLLGTGTDAVPGEKGRYGEVRIPQKISQLKVSVPTRIIFNVYTNGIDDTNHGFIAPLVTLNSESASFEDSLTLQTTGGEIVKDYGRKNKKTNVGFLGVKEDGSSSYTLDAYSDVTEEQMSQSVAKPIVCIEAEADIDTKPRIVLKQDADYSAEPVSWFAAPTGDTNLQLKVPGDYESGANTKRYYQIPKDIVDDQDGKTVLNGFHKMRLAFSIGETE